MKALFVYPEFPDTYWSFKHALPFEGRRSAFPPLGLLTVSAMLPADWERWLVDMNVRRLKDSHIEWADMVCCTAMIVQKESLREVVARCKAKGKRVTVGCPFSCEFCDIIEIYGRVPRTKSNPQMLAELDALLAAGWRGTVFIVDDNFIGNKRNVRQLLPELAEWQERNGRPFSFLTEASV